MTATDHHQRVERHWRCALDPRGRPFDGLMEGDVVLRRGGGVVGRRVPDGAGGIVGLRARGLHPRWTEGVFKKMGSDGSHWC